MYPGGDLSRKTRAGGTLPPVVGRNLRSCSGPGLQPCADFLKQVSRRRARI